MSLNCCTVKHLFDITHILESKYILELGICKVCKLRVHGIIGSRLGKTLGYVNCDPYCMYVASVI